MTNERIKEAVEQYKIMDRSEAIYRNNLRKEIHELEKLIVASNQKQIYRFIYNKTDGDYRIFVEKVAEALRKEGKP